MDPVKLLEIKKSQDKRRSTASNTVPIACNNCGSNDYYIQTLQQANFLTSLYPGLPSFKIPSDDPKDSFPIHPQFFSRPLFQPVFHNNSLLSNAFFGHNNIGLTLPNPYHFLDEQTRAKFDDNGIPIQIGNCSDCVLNQIRQASQCNDKTNPKKHQSKENGETNTKEELKKHCHVQNEEESNTNSQCVCNNSSPWMYSPFVLPIISYYILWNSQCSNPKLTPGDHFCNHNQMRQNVKENGKTKVSDDPSKGETQPNGSKVKLPKPSKDRLSEELWGDDRVPKSEWKINNQKSSSSFLSLNSMDYGEDVLFSSKRRNAARIPNNSGSKKSHNKETQSCNEQEETEEAAPGCETNLANHSDAHDAEPVKNPSLLLSTNTEEEGEEEEEEEEKEEEREGGEEEEEEKEDEDAEEEGEKQEQEEEQEVEEEEEEEEAAVEEETEEENDDECENGSNNNNNNDSFDEDEDKESVEDCNEESLTSEQVPDLEVENFKNELDTPTETLTAPVSAKSSNEKLRDDELEEEKIMTEYTESVSKDRVTSKKLIKNFTMSDEMHSKFYENSKVLVPIAAGGDLGEHCVGYRMGITPRPAGQRGNVQNLIKNGNELETNEMLLKGDCPLENETNNMKKNLQDGEFENKSKAKTNVRNFKSGIAKLSTNFMARSYDSSMKKSDGKNSEQMSNKTRRKHNCITIGTTTENNETNSKLQKFKQFQEGQRQKLNSARENFPPNKTQRPTTTSTDTRQKKKNNQFKRLTVDT